MPTALGAMGEAEVQETMGLVAVVDTLEEEHPIIILHLREGEALLMWVLKRQAL